MSRFIIDTIQRGEGYLAIICPENALWKEASVGGGATERSAVSEAINAYFTRQAPGQEVVIPEPVALSEPNKPAPYERVETLYFIRALLKGAIERQGTAVGIEYEDYNERVTSRVIEPRRLDGGEFTFSPEKLIALDVAKQEHRTFRLDRIKAAWNV